MPFPTPRQLLDALPAGDYGLTESDAQKYIDRWKNSLEFQPTTTREWALAEDLVEDGATAELLRLQAQRSAMSIPAEANTLKQNARTQRGEYNDLRATDEEYDSDPTGWVGKAPF